METAMREALSADSTGRDPHLNGPLFSRKTKLAEAGIIRIGRND
jgi:hypothetical protein